MKSSLEHLLDACIAELNSGIDLEAVLAAHPDHADELRPMLAAVAWMQLDIPPPARRVERKGLFMNAVAKRRRLVESTEGYIVELKAGVPLEELLARAEASQHPMLIAAYRMATTEPPAPSPEKVAAGKAMILALAERKRAERRAAASRHALLRGGVLEVVRGLRAGPTLGRRVWSGTVAMAVAAIFLGAGLAGVGHAAASSLPGEPLYGVKRLRENARLWLTLDEADRADLYVRFSDDRLREILKLAAGDRPVPADLLLDWLNGRPDLDVEVGTLSAAQQALLAQLVRDQVTPAARRELQAGLARPAALDELVAWSDGWLAAAAASARPASPPVQEPEQPFDTTLLPGPRQQPQGELGQARSDVPVKPAVPRRVDGPVPAPSAGDSANVLPPVQSAADDPRASDEDEDEKKPGYAGTEPGDEGTPPPYGQPGIDEPEATPPPTSPSGSGNQAPAPGPPAEP